MRIQVEGARCQAYGLCVEHAPAAFQLDDWGYATAADDGLVTAPDVPGVEKAIAECPAQAIRRIDSD
ncbi:ferredoxin [Pseudonocardia sulfidoxydans NBRC 16205]|uniref:Ferredoxin n=1 Tax=Pseudonocardia sulfidoxydans NBRC 16205 TaxID=1223511 RepID=A0A511DQ23_9PSEU|nr:ferredoxin [Pseudonocardia sulfidoxydans]GEL26941.1 ferredoxin [Pseudonocardia sulfidoxydans NBRC 16205]